MSLHLSLDIEVLTLPACEDTFTQFALGGRNKVQGIAAAIFFVRKQLSVSGLHFCTGGYKVFGLRNQREYLDAVISGKYALKGTSDVAIAPYKSVEAYSCSSVACVLIEFKTTEQF